MESTEENYYNLELKKMDDLAGVDAVIVAVMHRHYRKMGLEKIAGLCSKGTPIIIDVKSGFSRKDVEKEGIIYWRL